MSIFLRIFVFLLLILLIIAIFSPPTLLKIFGFFSYEFKEKINYYKSPDMPTIGPDLMAQVALRVKPYQKNRQNEPFSKHEKICFKISHYYPKNERDFILYKYVTVQYPDGTEAKFEFNIVNGKPEDAHLCHDDLLEPGEHYFIFTAERYPNSKYATDRSEIRFPVTVE